MIGHNPLTSSVKLSYVGRQNEYLAMVMATVMEETGEFCIAVGFVTRTAGILT